MDEIVLVLCKAVANEVGGGGEQLFSQTVFWSKKIEKEMATFTLMLNTHFSVQVSH